MAQGAEGCGGGREGPLCSRGCLLLEFHVRQANGNRPDRSARSAQGFVVLKPFGEGRLCQHLWWGCQLNKARKFFICSGKGVFFCFDFKFPLILGGLYLDNLPCEVMRQVRRSAGLGKGSDLSAILLPVVIDSSSAAETLCRGSVCVCVCWGGPLLSPLCLSPHLSSSSSCCLLLARW